VYPDKLGSGVTGFAINVAVAELNFVSLVIGWGLSFAGYDPETGGGDWLCGKAHGGALDFAISRSR